MQEVIIIPQNGISKSYKITCSDLDNEEYYHSYYLIKYAKENKIDIKDEKSSGLIATSFAKMGISVLIIENRYMFVYLPEKLTINQANFYVENKKVLRKFNINYAYIEDENLKYTEFDEDTSNSSKLKKMYKHINTNIVKQVEGDENEYGRTI